MITSQEEQLIYNLLTDKIDKDEFYNNYPINLTLNKDYFYKILLEAINNKDIESIETCFDIIEYLFDDEYIEDKLTPIYRQLIFADWIPYFLLERLLDSLKITKENRKYYIGILSINKFIDTDIPNIESFMVPIWNKCLWNLYKTDTLAETLTILHKYQDSPYKDVRNTSKNLIDKIKVSHDAE